MEVGINPELQFRHSWNLVACQSLSTVKVSKLSTFSEFQKYKSESMLNIIKAQ